MIGVRGSKEDCTTLLKKIRDFLKERLQLNLSETKTLITNANEDKALYLGTEIFRIRHQSFSSSQFGFNKRNGREVRLEAPRLLILKKLTTASFIKGGIPSPRFL